jgi:hypothetical protein
MSVELLWQERDRLIVGEAGPLSRGRPVDDRETVTALTVP